MHVVIRRYRVRLGTIRAVVSHAERQLLPLVRELPGFAAYYLADVGAGVLATIALFQTADGAAAAVRLQSEWFRDEWASLLPLPPEVVTGEVLARSSLSEVVMDERGLVSELATAEPTVAFVG